MIPRKKSISEIEYILVTKRPKLMTPVLPSPSFNNEVFSFIKYCPIDLLQLVNSVQYYEISYLTNINNPHDFGIIYSDNFIEFFIEHFNQLKIRVFFIDSILSNPEEIITFLKTHHSPLHFYKLINNDKKIDIENQIKNAFDFLQNIFLKSSEILEALKHPEFSLSLSVNVNFKPLVSFNYFKPTRNNFFVINSIIGNFYYKPIESEVEMKNFSKRAELNKNSFERQELYSQQIKNLDSLLTFGINEGVLPLVSSIQPIYSPLILVAPFNNPDFDKFISLPQKEAKDITSFLQAEQTENYISIGKDDENNQGLMGVAFGKTIIEYLDNISFLHASFTFSPTVRLPIMGKSIYRELSFFRTNAFAHLNNHNNRKNLQKTILKFSKIYKEKCLSVKMEKLISKRNSQIVLISDLPLEWLTIEDVPLTFTHDICRLPTTFYNGLMSVFALNNLFKYVIPSDILNKTLVIFGTNELSFRFTQDMCVELSVELGFTTVRCNSIQDVRIAIEKYRPEFLIFDCHGTYDESLNSTILWIGNEKLTPEIIVNNHINAPIIFLSSCGTAPTYGTINTIANAFFETGSFSVTTTYLPVEIYSSSVLYLRLLNKLAVASEKGFHKNWLEFVSHIIRSSYIMDKFIFNKNAKVNEEMIVKKNAEVLTDSLVFDKRRNVFKNIDTIIADFYKDVVHRKKDIIPEYLFYSNLGRSDLIFFQSWLDKFNSIAKIENMPKELF
ncbi:MAG: hypothetical protein JWN78_2365 [Bacteroidota bacterium]|nr:hypothetical protein [Bacteroidota bacterium]